MGVVHFMGLGKAVGAVTCAVDYIEKALDIADKGKHVPNEITNLFGGSGGINHEESNKGKIEAIVFFTSKEVINNELKASSYSSCKEPLGVRSEVIKNLDKVWKNKPKIGRKIYWCEVDIDNFQDCFDKILKVAYRFYPPDNQGKEIWCNLTGGANTINLSLISMARWTGISTTNYLISQRRDYQKEVTVPKQIKTIRPNKDNYFNIVPYLKTDIDTVNFYEILMKLESIDKDIKTKKLHSQLMGDGLFLQIDEQKFRRKYMLKLYGLGYTNFDERSDLVSISEAGKAFTNSLEQLETYWAFEAKLKEDNIDIVEESKAWQWFQEVDNLDKVLVS